MAAPDYGWMPFIKLLFGFVMLIVLAILAAIIALGKVSQDTSYGLNLILGGLLTLSGGFANWAFRESHSGKSDETEKTDETNQTSETEGQTQGLK